MLYRLPTLFKTNSFKQVSLYTITGTLTKIISFAALPFFVNALSEGDIGILNILNSSIIFLTPIISMGALYTISVDYFKLAKPDYATVFSTSLLIPLAVSLLLIPLFIIFWQPLSRAFSFRRQFIWLIPVCLFLNFCFEAFIILLRVQNKVKLFATVTLLKITVEISLAIALILFAYVSWYSRALGYFFSILIIGFLFFFYIKRNSFLVSKLDFGILKKELLFGLSGLLLQTAVFFINTSDKFFVMAQFGKVQAGFYSIAGTFATIQYIVSTSLMQYLQPVLYKKFAEKEKWKNIKGIYKKYILVMLVASISLFFFTVLVYHYLLKQSYKAYLHYFYLLCISSFIWSMSNIFLQFIIFNKHKKVILRLSLVSIIFALLINYFAAHFLTINWLCFGQILTNIFVLSLILYYNKKLNCFD
ncbi:MAG: lipopolysaccharide biosynthesis protein [Ginsengibacter sp.]